MILALLLMLLFFSSANSKERESNKKKAEEKKREEERAKVKAWEYKVEDLSLQRAITSNLNEDKIVRELQMICCVIGIDYTTLSRYEKIFILMVNKGCLPSDVVRSGYYEQSNYIIQFDPSKFKDNALKIIPWAIERLKSFGIYDCVYAHLKGGGYSKLYVQVGSEAYNYLIDMGVKFSEFIWETEMWPSDLKKAVIRVEQIGEKDMLEFRSLAKRLKVTEL